MIKVPKTTFRYFHDWCHILNWYDGPLLYTFNDNEGMSAPIKLAWACCKSDKTEDNLLDEYLVVDTNFTDLSYFTQAKDFKATYRLIRKGIDQSNIVYLMKCTPETRWDHECYVLNPTEALEYLK